MIVELNTKSNPVSLLQTTEIIAPIPRAVYSVLCAFRRVRRQATALAGVWFVHQINANFLFFLRALASTSQAFSLPSWAAHGLRGCRLRCGGSMVVEPPTGASLSCLSAISPRTGAVLCADSVSAAGTHNRRRADGRGCLSLPLRSGMHKNSSAPSSLRENTPPPFTCAHADQSSAFSSSPAVDSELNMCVNSVGVSLCVGRRPCTMATILIVVWQWNSPELDDTGRWALHWWIWADFFLMSCM